MRIFRIAITTLLLVASHVTAQDATKGAVQESSLGKTNNVHACGSLFLAGQPTEADIKIIKQKGIKRVITLRQGNEVDWDESARFEKAGLKFTAIPFRAPETLTDDVFSRIRTELQKSAQEPTLLHCGSANRVGAVWMVFRVLDQGIDLETATREAKVVGLRNAAYEKKAIDFINRNRVQKNASVKPGINENFLKSDLDIDQWIGRFEIESREVYAARSEVLAVIGIGAGSAIADIGAGTGLYTKEFSKAVGESGWVYAVDISPRFVEHLNKRTKSESLKNVTTMLCHDDSICLPANSVDHAFICDTYHHFEYPDKTLASIYKALKNNGKLIVIDFNRIPGVSREWTINHVRGGKELFRGEIEAAGFEFVAERTISGFKENYLLEFKRK
ncbi:methyltransferase domain-containing protein [Planctomycetota bacterium]